MVRRERAPALAARVLQPVLIVTVLAILLDVAQWLRAAPLWVDEEMIALNFRDRSFWELPGPLWLGQGAPLGWLLVQRAAILTLGTSELVLRFVPVLFGAGTLVVAAWIAVRWLTPLAGTVFVFICWIGQWMSHYRFEVKHYSADAFAALLLPALAAWAADADDEGAARIRLLRWWLVASLAQWIAYGALLVTPLCALLLTGAILARHGVRPALHFSAGGLLWLTSFAAHYALSLQYTDHSPHLRSYWAADLPPEGSGPLQIAGWIADRLGTLATNPGGAGLAIALWVCVAGGFVFSRRPLVGAMFATVPVAAFALAALGRVPLGDRLALWIVPALYAGVALLLDTGVRSIAEGWRQKAWRASAIGSIATIAALSVSAAIVVRGYSHLDLEASGDSNHALDDRRAVAWMNARRQPGDVIISTRLGWPALWWYGPVPLRHPSPGGRLPDGSLMLEASADSGKDCGRDLWHALDGRRRVLVHVGFPDAPDDFYQSLVGELTRFGDLVDSARFSIMSRTAVIRLHPRDTAGALERGSAAHDPRDECVRLGIARRW